MDKRIGYGLSFLNAVEKALKAVQRIEGEEVGYFSFSTKEHSVVWAELRDDGWRVYRPKEEGELPV